MKMVYVIIVGLVIACGLIYYFTTRKNSDAVDSKSTQRTIESQENAYAGLRAQVFSSTPEQIGLTTTTDEKPYAIVMDMGMGEDGTATLVSIIDGNASMYLSSGGGVIGGFAHETVRKASIDFVNMGQDYFTKMSPVDSFPLPKGDNVRFYILTNKGKYSVEEKFEKIENEKSDWLQLFYEGNKVITELRMTTEQK
ncbi:MAG: hypothetical protein ACKO96_01235 [Flammeovirgaceae bacterium]